MFRNRYENHGNAIEQTPISDLILGLVWDRID